uniref:Zinc-binding protein A33 n=2 Tax=Larimichthys crocea TaxID=215358 RepID=A0A0F8ALI7_LARCR
MSFNYCVLSEEPLLCSICLDVFTHPVTIPCGHNFCKKCITRNWDLKGKYECPLCKDMFIRRPVLRVNSVLSEIADQFRQSPLKKPDISSEQQYMFSTYSLLSEEQFLCSICLDVFTHPVTIPCGHNFCKKCITQHWDVNVQCQCPMCKDVFDRRPELRVNTFISEMAAQFRQSAVNKASSCSVQKYANSGGDVLCDVCTGTKLKALKSCLTCLASYCETHLEPHHRIPGLKRHTVIDPVENLEERMCKKHDRPFELYCKTDQMCVCLFCTESDHKPHVFTSVVEEYKVKKAKLEKVEDEIQQMIQERRLKIQEIKQSVKLSQEDADRETAESVEIFTVLIQSVQKGLAQLTDTIEEKQKTTEKQAKGFVKELEEEISELMKRKVQVDQLSRMKDHLQFLQSFPTLNTAPPTKDWMEVRVHSSYEGTLRRAVVQLEETLSKQMKKLCADTELKRVQQYAVDVTLDPDTASPYLVLSDDEKQVKSVVIEKNIPDNPKRFSMCNGVLGKQGFSSGRFYFEVQVKDKTEWDLGVASELVNRKGKIKLSPKNGFWTVWLRHGTEYKALAGPGVPLSLKSKPQKVGVFVDYEKGLVSFHDADTAALIYSFTGYNFTEKLLPYFSPCGIAGGRNAAPLILLPLPLP